MHLNARSNEYLALAGARFYDRTPKAVFAALAISFAMRIGDDEDSMPQPHDMDRIEAILLEEWRILNVNGIVPQKAPKRLAGKGPR